MLFHPEPDPNITVILVVDDHGIVYYEAMDYANNQYIFEAFLNNMYDFMDNEIIYNKDCRDKPAN